MQTTRDLDDVFYSILEKASVLQSTISNLQELSMLTGNLHKEFQTETGGLESEMREQIDAFGEFHDSKHRIDNLEARIKTSKGKADELSGRLEAARARVQKLEAEEAEYQAMISRTFFWILDKYHTLMKYIRTTQNDVDDTSVRLHLGHCSLDIPSFEATFKPRYLSLKSLTANSNSLIDNDTLGC